MSLQWRALAESQGYNVFELHCDGSRSRKFGIRQDSLVAYLTDTSWELIHEAYRPLLVSMLNGWVPTPAYHTQVKALLTWPVTQESQATNNRWNSNQMEDVVVYTNVPALAKLLSPFFTLADHAVGASLLVLTPDIQADSWMVENGAVLYLSLTPAGALQLWDAQIKFENPVTCSFDLGTVLVPAVAHLLAALLANHVTSFGVERSFIEVHPLTLNVSRMYYPMLLDEAPEAANGQ